MENANNEFLTQIRNMPDAALKQRYTAVSQKIAASENAAEHLSELSALMNALKERNISLRDAMAEGLQQDRRKTGQGMLKDNLKSGIGMLALGIALLLVGGGLTAVVEGKILFYGAIIIGGILTLGGLFLVISSIFIRIRFRNRF